MAPGSRERPAWVIYDPSSDLAASASARSTSRLITRYAQSASLRSDDRASSMMRLSIDSGRRTAIRSVRFSLLSTGRCGCNTLAGAGLHDVPPGYGRRSTPGMVVVVMLHGCARTALARYEHPLRGMSALRSAAVVHQRMRLVVLAHWSPDAGSAGAIAASIASCSARSVRTCARPDVRHKNRGNRRRVSAHDLQCSASASMISAAQSLHRRVSGFDLAVVAASSSTRSSVHGVRERRGPLFGCARYGLTTVHRAAPRLDYSVIVCVEVQSGRDFSRRYLMTWLNFGVVANGAAAP